MISDKEPALMEKVIEKVAALNPSELFDGDFVIKHNEGLELEDALIELQLFRLQKAKARDHHDPQP